MLNPNQQAFVEAYASGGFKNGTEAALKAGYAEKTAHVTASRLLKNDKVVAEIEKLREKTKQVACCDASWVLNQLMNVIIVNSQEIPKVSFQGDQLTTKSGGQAWKMIDAPAVNAALKTLTGCLGMDGKTSDKDTTIQALAETLQGILKNG